MRRLLVVLAGTLVVLLPCAPAGAHGGKVSLEVAGDGAAGVTVRAKYADGHPVGDRILRLVLTATGDGGRTAGPIQLNPAGEGRGFYASGNVLGPGRWAVVVTAPAADNARAEAVVETRAPQTAPPSAGAGTGTKAGAGGASAKAGANGAGGAADRARGGTNGGAAGWWLLATTLVVAAAAGLLVAARRSRRSPPPPA
jgi:hypothetical protein